MRFKEGYIFCVFEVCKYNTIHHHHYSLFFFARVGGGGVIDLDFVSVNKNAKKRASVSIKQAWSILVNFQCIYIQLNLDKGQNMVALLRFGIFKVLFLIFYYYVPFNSKTANPPPRAPYRGTYPGHLTGVFLRTVVNLTQNEARQLGI